jgi:hypothetical protein
MGHKVQFWDPKKNYKLQLERNNAFHVFPPFEYMYYWCGFQLTYLNQCKRFL